ncbi:MAG: BON domain-containing protein [Betaproteobacteria bacterium]|nr:BON domain-containing protein [Betaproteobacteria bacterium]MBV9362152.1 BON domain-containing protein [Betaproteobacteria bacterium]
MRLLLAVLVAAAMPAFAQTTNDQATEQGRQTNNEYVSDATLTTKVHTALANDVGMRTMYSINVDSDKGVVTLKGKVDSQATKQRAEDVAKRVSGVTSVKNELQVKG